MSVRNPALRALRLMAPPLLAALLGAAAPANMPADSPVGVPEPAELYTGAQHGYTPPTLKGARVVELSGFEKLLADSKPVLLDVGMRDHKPENLPPGTFWLPTHRSIPGAAWLPNAGAAPMEPGEEAAFLKRVGELTGGDKGRALVVFCHPECWGSWNAGKRLVKAGYTGVHWFPEGVEGWQDAHDTAVVKPDPAWTSAAAQTAGAEAQR